MFCFFNWTKKRDKDWLWFTWIGLAGGVLNLGYLFVKNILQVSPHILFISNSLIRILNAVALLLLVGVMLRVFFKKRR